MTNCLKSVWEDAPNTRRRNIIQILTDMPAHNDRQARRARDTILTHWEQIHAQNPRDKTANIRTQQEGTTQILLKSSRTTGYAQYLEAVTAASGLNNPATNPKFIRKMHELYTMYSHVDDEISETVALATETKHCGKGKQV